MRYSQLLVLLWKDWIFHRRYPCVTLFEILLPLVLSFCSLFVVLNSDYTDGSRGHATHNTSTYKSYDPVKQYPPVGIIMYAPNISDTIELMEEAFRGISVTLLGLDSDQHIKNKSLVTSPATLWGAVIFNGFNGKTFPSSLDYTVLLSSWLFVGLKEKLETFYEEEEFERRISDFSHYKQSGFLAVQILIDLAYIKLRQAKRGASMRNVRILVKRLPVPALEVFGLDANQNDAVTSAIPASLSIGLLFFFLVAVKRVVDEKNNKAKEMMKMMGMTAAEYWESVFIGNFLLAAIICMVIAIMYSIPFTSDISVFGNSSFFVLLVTLLLYCASSLLLCFSFSTLFTKSSLCIAVITALWIITLVTALQDISLRTSYSKKMLACLMPNIALRLIFAVILNHEFSGNGISWGNINDRPFPSKDDFSVGSALRMAIVSCILYSVLLLYLDAIWPWQPGVPKHPLFFIHKSFWCVMPTIFRIGSSDQHKSEYFEAEPTNLCPSLVMYHLTKEFRTANKRVTALKDVSLNIYPGEITALLGKNGAGKSTLMNILTGMFPPTTGTATINGYDVVRETNAARKHVGLCPQHNVLYNDLKVIEHLKLFVGLRGKNWWGLGKDLLDLLQELKLFGKLNALSKDLSGGMKRKLCLANAIIGTPQIVILDEPTTGLDPESRRSVWTLLQKMRSKCTILLTTHSMEEADALGDRIVIMSSGRIQCHGSPMFLKRRFDTGYKLRIEKSARCNVGAITNLIRHYIPEAKLTRNVQMELMYHLSSNVEEFGNLFRHLENSASELGVASFGVDVTTMDDVFMKVSQIVEVSRHRNGKDVVVQPKTNATLFSHLSVKPRNASLRKIKALLIKRAQCAKRSLYVLTFQIVLPLFAIIIYVSHKHTSSTSTSSTTKEIVYDLRDNFEWTKRGIFYLADNIDDSQSCADYYRRTLMSRSLNLVNMNSDLDHDILLLTDGYDDVRNYIKEYLIGASIRDTSGILSLTAWYNGIHYHLDPISTNILTNSLLRCITKDDNAEIVISAGILKVYKETLITALTTTFVFRESHYFFLFPVAFAFISSSFVLFPIDERVSRAKLLQRICGVTAATYWLGNFLWDFLTFEFASLFLLVPVFIHFERSDGVSSDCFGSIFLLLQLYGFSSIPLSYLISFIVNVPSTGFTLLTILNVAIGMVGILPLNLLTDLYFEVNTVKQMLWFLRILPNFAVSLGIRNIIVRSQTNVECVRYKKKALSYLCRTFKLPHHCCTKSVLQNQAFQLLPYLAWEDDAAGKDCFVLFLGFLIWSGFTLMLEAGVIGKFTFFMMNTQFVKQLLTTETEKDYEEDSDVRQERARIKDIILREAFDEDVLITYNLTKKFVKLRAVNNLTFGVHEKECFGLLGINGAGKTTTFRMLTGDLTPSSGLVYVKGKSLRRNLEESRMALGYCPQFDGLLGPLNVRETVQLYANLKGIPSDEIDSNVDKIIAMCGLEDFASKETRTFSGGAKRKLSLAIALIGVPPIILLDEPTAGIDPTSRHKIWETLANMKDTLGVSFVLTSNSMDECEALCNRLSVMVNGEFRCLGQMQRLKSKYGKGYTVIAKVKDVNQLKEVRTYIEGNIPSIELKAIFNGVVHYHISDTTLKWSTLFMIMDKAKEKYQLEDYIISGTTLEQIFLSFVRSQRGFH